MTCDLAEMAYMQQTAAFLLWYHALEGGEEMVAEMAGNNVINICLTIMDSADASTVDKSCAAGMYVRDVDRSYLKYIFKFRLT